MTDNNLLTELKAWKQALEAGAISQQEYDAEATPLKDRLRQSISKPAPNKNPYNATGISALQTKQSVLQQYKTGDELGEGSHRFKLISPIGFGGMGIVWKAIDLANSTEQQQEIVALKMLPPEIAAKATDLKRLKEEAQRARKLSHPNIVNVYNWHEDPNSGVIIIEMEYLTGRSIDKVLAEEGTPSIPLKRVIELLRPVARAVDWAYDQHQLVHRDLKPGNVILTDDDTIKVLDFGLSAVARASSGGSALVQDASGTQEYMPPEARRVHKVKRTRDVYALGVMAYELLTSECPWPGTTAMFRAEEKHEDDWPEKPSSITNEQWQALKNSLAYKATARPETLYQTIEVLDGAALKAVKEQQLEEASVKKKRQQAEAKKLVGKMVSIPAGKFKMGSNELDAEQPIHTVSIPSFLMGETAITFAQWDACVAAGGCKYKPEDEGWGRGDRPVINVSHDDVTQEYIPWLNKQTGKTYRLPTEAEWEYAARAGTTSAYSTGNCINTSQANYDGNYDWNNCGAKTGHYEAKTVKVASFAPNAYGLYDMHGNVWEWTQDGWNGDYKGAPEDGSARMTGDCGEFVLRGGSWYGLPNYLRSAFRSWNSASERSLYNGFRLVQGR